uniref:Uncharacterized protein n=1 Tax=Oryza meridionalis TaxID=40149 RepID=A0A0E0CVK9_9ORYZ
MRRRRRCPRSNAACAAPPPRCRDLSACRPPLRLRDDPLVQLNTEKSMENGTKAVDVGQRQLKIMEECLAATIPDSQSFVHSALLSGLASIT